MNKTSEGHASSVRICAEVAEVRPRCCGTVAGDGWDRRRQCLNSGNLEHEGSHFCKTHHPPTVKERDAKRKADWDAKWEKERAANRADAERKNEINRKAAAYDELLAQRDELLAALELAIKTAEFEDHPFRAWHAEARAAIAKATP